MKRPGAGLSTRAIRAASRQPVVRQVGYGTTRTQAASDVMAGAVVGSRERIAAVRSAQIDTGATLGPFAAG